MSMSRENGGRLTSGGVITYRSSDVIKGFSLLGLDKKGRI